MVSPLAEDRDPFGPTADPAAYVPRHETERVLARLLRCVRDENRPAALCGPPGLGKTLVLRLLASRLAYRFQPVYLPYGALPISGLCAWALRQLDEWADDDPRQALCDAAERRWAGGGGVLLLIDDANAMPIDTARELGQLRAKAGEALRVVVASLDDERATQVIEALGENVETVRLEQPMSEAESSQYVRARLENADVSRSLRERFDEATVARLYRISEGVPRSLHEAADAVLHPRLGDEAADASEDEGAAAERLEGLALEAAAAPAEAEETPAREVAEEADIPPAPRPPPRRAPEPEQIIPPRARTGFPVRPKRPFRRLVSQLRTTVLAALAVVTAAMIWLLVEGVPVEVEPVPEEPAAQAPPSPEPREPEPVAREPVEPAPQPELVPAPVEPAPQPELVPMPVVPVAEAEPAPVVPPPQAEPVVVAPAPVVEPAPLEVAPEVAPAGVEEIAEEAPPAPVPVIEPPVAESVAAVQPPAPAAEALAPAPEGTGALVPQSFPVNINAKPWAVIEVDGVEVGVTPLAHIPLAAGPRQIRARMPDGRVVERLVEIDAETRFVAFE